jgi:hypothetical protein
MEEGGGSFFYFFFCFCRFFRFATVPALLFDSGDKEMPYPLVQPITTPTPPKPPPPLNSTFPAGGEIKGKTPAVAGIKFSHRREVKDPVSLCFFSFCFFAQLLRLAADDDDSVTCPPLSARADSRRDINKKKKNQTQRRRRRARQPDLLDTLGRKNFRRTHRHRHRRRHPSMTDKQTPPPQPPLPSAATDAHRTPPPQAGGDYASDSDGTSDTESSYDSSDESSEDSYSDDDEGGSSSESANEGRPREGAKRPRQTTEAHREREPKASRSTPPSDAPPPPAEGPTDEAKSTAATMQTTTTTTTTTKTDTASRTSTTAIGQQLIDLTEHEAWPLVVDRLSANALLALRRLGHRLKAAAEARPLWAERLASLHASLDADGRAAYAPLVTPHLQRDAPGTFAAYSQLRAFLLPCVPTKFRLPRVFFVYPSADDPGPEGETGLMLSAAAVSKGARERGSNRLHAMVMLPAASSGREDAVGAASAASTAAALVGPPEGKKGRVRSLAICDADVPANAFFHDASACRGFGVDIEGAMATTVAKAADTVVWLRNTAPSFSIEGGRRGGRSGRLRLAARASSSACSRYWGSDAPSIYHIATGVSEEAAHAWIARHVPVNGQTSPTYAIYMRGETPIAVGRMEGASHEDDEEEEEEERGGEEKGKPEFERTVLLVRTPKGEHGSKDSESSYRPDILDRREKDNDGGDGRRGGKLRNAKADKRGGTRDERHKKKGADGEGETANKQKRKTTAATTATKSDKKKKDNKKKKNNKNKKKSDDDEDDDEDDKRKGNKGKDPKAAKIDGQQKKKKKKKQNEAMKDCNGRSTASSSYSPDSRPSSPSSSSSSSWSSSPASFAGGQQRARGKPGSAASSPAQVAERLMAALQEALSVADSELARLVAEDAASKRKRERERSPAAPKRKRAKRSGSDTERDAGSIRSAPSTATVATSKGKRPTAAIADSRRKTDRRAAKRKASGDDDDGSGGCAVSRKRSKGGKRSAAGGGGESKAAEEQHDD